MNQIFPNFPRIQGSAHKTGEILTPLSTEQTDLLTTTEQTDK